MSELFHQHDEAAERMYWDRLNYTSPEEQVKALEKSSTVYVGNLTFTATESMLHFMFSSAGPVKRIIMGINSTTRTPCGFCFVEFYTRQAAIDCVNYLSGTVCDGNIIRCELDAGFKPGRQFGRGRSGGQIRDEKRKPVDSEGGRNSFDGQKRRRYEGGDRGGSREQRESFGRNSRDYGRTVTGNGGLSHPR